MYGRYVNPEGQTGQWLTFFTLQGPLVLLESYITKNCGFKLPRWCQIFLTLSVLLLVGHHFFFPPVVNAELDQMFYTSVEELAKLPFRHYF
jgi:hypothetical protein